MNMFYFYDLLPGLNCFDALGFYLACDSKDKYEHL